MKKENNSFLKPISITILTTMTVGLLGIFWNLSIEGVEARVSKVAEKVAINSKNELHMKIKRNNDKIKENETKTIEKLNKIDEKLDKILFKLIK